MKAKAPLALIELCIMLLVFALSAAICLRAFSWADSTSRKSEARDRLLLEAENAAEILKSYHGDLTMAASFYGGSVQETGEQWILSYDRDWNMGGDDYQITVTLEKPELEYLGSALVVGEDARKEELIRFHTGWQEVSPHA